MTIRVYNRSDTNTEAIVVNTMSVAAAGTAGSAICILAGSFRTVIAYAGLWLLAQTSWK